MTNDSLPLNPELLDSTTAVTAVIQAVHGAAEGVPSSGSTDPVGTVGTVTAGDTGETERNKEIGKHKVVAVATAVVDSPLTSLSAAPLHSANENGLLVQENQEGKGIIYSPWKFLSFIIGASADRNLLPVVPDFMLPEGAPSVLLNNSPLSAVIPAPDPGLTRKDLFVDSNTAELVPPATSDENGPKATQTKKGTKMRPNGSLSARSVAFQKICDCSLVLTNVLLFVETSVQRIGVQHIRMGRRRNSSNIMTMRLLTNIKRFVFNIICGFEAYILGLDLCPALEGSQGQGISYLLNFRLY
jgi:hypothetical protein